MQIGKNYQHFDFFKKQKNLGPAPCFFLYGPEYFLKDKITAVLLRKFGTEDSEQFDTVKMYAEDVRPSEVYRTSGNEPIPQ